MQTFSDDICVSYSTDILFLHQSTGRLPVHGCTNTHGLHVNRNKAKHINDARSLRTKATFSCEVNHASMHHAGPGTWLATGHVVVYVVVPGLSISLVHIYMKVIPILSNSKIHPRKH